MDNVTNMSGNDEKVVFDSGNPDDYVKMASETRHWIERNASVIIAVSSVVTALAVRKNLRFARGHAETLTKISKIMSEEMRARNEQVKIIDKCLARGRDFDFYPGLGVLVHEAVDA